MAIKELLNNDFDCNCNFKIFKGFWHEGEPLVDTTKQNEEKVALLLKQLSNCNIQYITINDNCLIIEI